MATCKRGPWIRYPCRWLWGMSCPWICARVSVIKLRVTSSPDFKDLEKLIQDSLTVVFILLAAKSTQCLRKKFLKSLTAMASNRLSLLYQTIVHTNLTQEEASDRVKIATRFQEPIFMETLRPQTAQESTHAVTVCEMLRI
jgi:hypothetical protein